MAIAATDDTAQRLRKLKATNIQTLSESGLFPDEIQTLSELGPAAGKTIRFISMGRLLHWKGFHLGLKAFAKAALPDAEYLVLGEGPARERLQALAQELGIAQQVKFLGRLPRPVCLSTLGSCHALVHPSLHDSGGWVCLEAMASGRPVICLDLGGPGVQVTPEAGFKIPAINPEQVVQQISKAMIELANSQELRSQMGQAGQRVVSDRYNWDKKILTQIQLYEQVLQQTKSLVSTHS